MNYIVPKHVLIVFQYIMSISTIKTTFNTLYPSYLTKLNDSINVFNKKVLLLSLILKKVSFYAKNNTLHYTYLTKLIYKLWD